MTGVSVMVAAVYYMFTLRINMRTQIVAVPTLIRRLPHPLRVIGDLSNTDRVMSVLNL